MGGIINSGNSVVGDSITQIHNYIQGNPGSGSAFEGRKPYMAGLIIIKRGLSSPSQIKLQPLT